MPFLRRFLILAFALFPLLVVATAQAAITARVTYQTHAAYLANGNPAPGEIMFMRSDIPNAGNDNGGVANGNTARLVLGGNVTNAVVNLGSTPGHFTANFNNAAWNAASGCAITPINFSTSQYLADGESIDITVTCTMPDTPPTLVSAATSTNGSQVILNWSEAIDYYGNGEDFRVYQNGTPRTITAASPTGSQLSLTVSPAINAGTTVTLDYVDIGNLYDLAGNQAVNFSGRPVTNNVAGGLPPNVTDARISIAGATGNGGVFRLGDTVTASWNNTTSGDNNSGITGVTVDFSQFGGGAAVAATNNAGIWSASHMLAAGITASNRNVSITATNSIGSTTRADTSNATVDSVVPTVVSIAPASGASASNTTVNFTASFSEAVTGVSTGDFTLVVTGSATGNIASASGSGSSYTVTVNDITGNGTLKLNLKASTNISDTAGNSGLAAFTAGTTHTVAIATAPGAPTIGTATAGDAQASVSFSAPASNGGSAITGYTVTSNPGGITAGGNGFTTSPITLSGLSNGTAYTFTVTATNAVGTSTASAASNSVTPKANQTITFTNPGAQNFGTTPTLTASASSSLPVSFSSATTGVCTITSGGSLTFITAGSCTINADQAGNAATNAATTISQSFLVNAVVPGAPVIGTATAGNTQASVSFSAPANTGGSSITGYTVTANPGGATASGVVSPLVVSGLSNGQAYTFTVTATNVAGTGSASAASNAVTPAAPQVITFANPGAQNFGTTPTLTASASSSLPVSFSSATPAVCTITSGGTLSFITAGICTINANQAGNAAWLAASQVSRSFTVNPVVPGAPAIGTATGGDTQASVSFSAPVNTGGSSITGYTVTANPGGATASGAASPLVVSGLSNGQAYTFTVTATNVAGTGSASAASNAVTPAAPQVITFANPGAQNFGTTPTLSASASSGLAVSFSSATPAVCTITSGGLLGFASTGSCTIHADQPGNASYLPAPRVSRTFSVNGVVPSAPTIGTATVAGASAVSVGFSAPLFDGGAAITGYTVISSPGGFTATGAGSPITVTGLTPGTSYTFVVTATNANGTGAASAPSNAVTPVPPLAVAPVSATVAYGTASPISLAITGAASSVAVATAPAHGTAVASGTTITYTPAPGHAGSDSFSYTASDAYTTTAAATVSITVSAPTVVIDTASLAVATADSAYTQTLSSSGGASPYRYALSSGALPAGLSLSASGTLSGTPTATGTFAFDVTSTDSSTGTGPFSTTRSYSLQVDAPLLAVAPVSATIGYGAGPSPVSLAITGVASSVAVATAPAHGTAVVSGTGITYTPAPGYAGSDSFSYTASDAYTTTAAATVSITVSAPTVVIDTASLAVATADSAYTQSLASSGGAAPYRYAVTAGALPAGLSLSASGTLSGTPTATGTFAFDVTSTDSSTGTGPFSATRSYSLQVDAPLLAVAPVSATIGYGAGPSPVSLAITGVVASVAVATAPAHGTAVVSGTGITYTPAPGYAGSDSFSYTASDAYTTTAAATVSITVSAPTVVIDTASLAVATADSAYTQSLASSGGAAPYRYAVTAGALPAGLSLSASGTLSGTPTATGTFAFDVTSTDSSTGTGPFSATRSYSLQVDAPLLAVAPVSATIGYGAGPSPVSLAITGTASSVTVVSAPAHGSAVASGTTITYTPAPGYAGPDSFSYTASDAYTTTAAATVSITVSAPSLSLTTPALPAATGSAAYAQTLAASGGSAPYRYAVSSGALPPGLVLASDGSLGGTPTQAGSFAFAITVTDSSTGTGPFSASQGYTLVVGAPVLTVDPLPVATGGQDYRVQLSTQGGAAPYAFSVGTGTLPPGLVLSASGEVSGIPTAAGSYDFSLQVVDANGFSSTQAFNQVVDAGSQLIQAFVATPAAPVFAPGGTFALSASGGASGNPVVFASLTPTVCQVQGSTVTMLTAGQCSLTADQAGNATYQAAAQVRLEVAIALATPELGWIQDISKVYGEDAFELPDPQSSSPGTFSFSSSDPAVATVSGRTVTLVGEGVTVLTASQATTANYTAASIQVRLLVSARPDPTADPRVANGLQAQIDASVQFAQIQSGNIRDRLRQVRGGAVSNDFRFALTHAGGQGVPGLTLPRAAADSVMPRLPEGWGMWVAGSASFGRNGRNGLAGGGSDFTTGGLTVGIDHAVDEQVLLGMAGSWARQDTDFDSSSSRVDADQRSLAVYGLWRVGGNLFVDGMLANGWLDFASVRWNDLAQGSAHGRRSGQQWFGSLTFGHERLDPAGMTLTSYGRYDWHRATLDGYSESGLGAFDLVYGRQRVVNNALALGVQGSFQFTRDWGSLRPHWSLEYRSALDNRGQATINYVLRPAATDYRLDLRSYNDDLLSLGAGMDLQLDSGWLFSLLLGHERGRASMRSSSIGLQLRYGSGGGLVPGDALGLLPAQPGQCGGQLPACPAQAPQP